jgi:hypothetical protein
MLRSLGLPELLVIALVLGVVVVATIPFCKISERLGFSKWWGLLNLCPFGTMIWAYYVGFSKWPKDSSPP